MSLTQCSFLSQHQASPPHPPFLLSLLSFLLPGRAPLVIPKTLVLQFLRCCPKSLLGITQFDLESLSAECACWHKLDSLLFLNHRPCPPGLFFPTNCPLTPVPVSPKNKCPAHTQVMVTRTALNPQRKSQAQSFTCFLRSHVGEKLRSRGYHRKNASGFRACV